MVRIAPGLAKAQPDGPRDRTSGRERKFGRSMQIFSAVTFSALLPGRLLRRSRREGRWRGKTPRRLPRRDRRQGRDFSELRRERVWRGFGFLLVPAYANHSAG